VGSACAILACTAGWINYDGAFADGCECKTPVVSSSCASALSFGSLAPGQTATGPLDGIPGGTVAYYAVSFPPTGPNTYGGGTPSISFVRNDGGRAVFDVFQSCSGGNYACASEGTISNGVTSFAFADSMAGTNYLVRGQAWPSSAIIRVRQAPGTTGCPTYQLRVAR
jgi:hypothetical protein